MPVLDLSPRQRDVLDFIQASLSGAGTPPTYREIGDALGITSTNGVADHVKALIRKGYLRRAKPGVSVARGLVLTQRAQARRRGSVVPVPVVGAIVPDGCSLLSEEVYERTLHLDRSLLTGAAVVFAVALRDGSMVEEGLYEGDLVLARRASVARPGELVVVVWEGEVLVRIYFPEPGRQRVKLQPAHPTMPPLYASLAREDLVQGVVVAAHRKYRPR